MKRVQIFGERCSGTNYLEDLLRHNCRGGVEIVSDYGHKHLFNRFRPRKAPDDDAVYVHISRNAYDWVRSIHENPHHTRYWGLSFGAFLRQVPWISTDYEGSRFRGEYEEGLIESVDGTVIDLRNEKNRAFERIWLPGKSVHVRYEDLRREPAGTLTRICRDLGLPITKEPFENVTTTEKGKERYKRKVYDGISAEDLAFMNERLDWVQEARLGYHRIDTSDNLEVILSVLYD